MSGGINKMDSKILCMQAEVETILFFQLVIFVCFNKAVDEFYSKIEGQKIDLKALQQVWYLKHLY